VGVDEALLMSNNEGIQNELMSNGGDRLVGAMSKLEPEAAVELAFESVLSRKPSDEEKQACLQYLEERQARSLDGLKQIAWALLTNPELRFNY